MTLIAPQPIETSMQSPLGEVAPMTHHRFSPSPLNRRRWQNFKSNRRGYWSFWIFLLLFAVSLFAELIANDRPFLIKFDGRLYFPAFVSYSETTFGGDFETAADYRDPYLQKLIADKGGTVVWPLIRYSYDTHNLDLPTPAPSKPTWMLTEAQCKEVVQKKGLTSCRDLEYNWLGTDDQGRDVVARLIYGFRISVLFGLGTGRGPPRGGGGAARRVPRSTRGRMRDPYQQSDRDGTLSSDYAVTSCTNVVTQCCTGVARWPERASGRRTGSGGQHEWRRARRSQRRSR